MSAHSAMKRALITGITGQDGSYLAELLLGKGYEVFGMIRRSSSFNTGRIDGIYQDPHDPTPRLHLLYGDMNDASSLNQVLRAVQPQEIYNLAAQSHVQVSFETPEYTANSDALGTLRILEAIRILGLEAHTRFYQASTSEMYGKVQEIPQKESTPFYPRSPYGAAKVYAYWITVNYREAYRMFACNGILFNHESPVRGETFVTRKITRAVARIRLGLQDRLYLGNLNSQRDWGYAGDFVEAMWLMLQQQTPEDFVIATGKAHSVREFVEKAFNAIGIHLVWRGSGTEETGVIDTVSFSENCRNSLKKPPESGQIVVSVDPRYFRPAEVEFLLGDPTKARTVLGWKPKMDFEELIRIMVEKDIMEARKDFLVEKEGFQIYNHFE